MGSFEILAKLLEHGFRFCDFEAYPRCVGVERNNFVALLEKTPEGGLRPQGSSGYLMGGKIGVLVERQGQSFFQAKQEEVSATPEMLEAYRRFQEELREMFAS